jgi:hypothetical protein
MESLIALMCRLFNSEQHLEGSILKSKKEKHEAVEVEMTF